MPDSKASTDCISMDLRVLVFGREPYPSSDHTWDIIFTHTNKNKPNCSYLCMYDKHEQPCLWLMRGVCTSPWCSAAFGTEKDVSAAAAATFVLLIGQRKEAVAQQLPGTSKVCTPRIASNQVIIKTGTVASPASWNVYVRRHKRETDQTCDGVI